MSYQIELNQQIDRAIIDQIIADSGLFGLTVYTNEAGNSVLEFYYYGKPNQPTQTHSTSSTNQPSVPNNPLARMAEEFRKKHNVHISTHSPTSPKAGEQGSQSRTRTYQVSFIPSRRTDQTQS